MSKGSNMHKLAAADRKRRALEARVDDMHRRFDNGCKHSTVTEDSNGDVWCASCHRPFGSVYDID